MGLMYPMQKMLNSITIYEYKIHFPRFSIVLIMNMIFILRYNCVKNWPIGYVAPLWPSYSKAFPGTYIAEYLVGHGLLD